MSARSKARKRALDVLFEADQRGLDPLDALAERIRTPGAQTALPEYACQLVEGVAARQSEIDERITSISEGWRLDRMPAVDRCVLRLGAYELLAGDVPPGVAVAEAVELAGTLSTDTSPGFVNGVLGRLSSLLAMSRGSGVSVSDAAASAATASPRDPVESGESAPATPYIRIWTRVFHP